MALGTSFERQKVEIGQDISLLGSLLSQMLSQSSLFIYAHVLFSATVKKNIPKETKYSHSLWRQNQCAASDCGFEVPAQAGE